MSILSLLKLNPQVAVASLAGKVLPWVALFGLALAAWFYVADLRTQIQADQQTITNLEAVNKTDQQQVAQLQQDQQRIDQQAAQLSTAETKLHSIANRPSAVPKCGQTATETLSNTLTQIKAAQQEMTP
jgi:hypothetical protein